MRALLRAITVPPLAISVLAATGCGRGSDPPARPVASRTATTPAPSPPAARWLEPRQPGDRCRRADGQDDRPHPSSPDGSVAAEDLSHGLAFVCTLRGREAVRLVVEADTFGDPAAVIVQDPAAGTARSDTLLLGETEPPYAGAPLVEGADLDGDGWTDVQVMTFHGSGGHTYDVFRYQPARHRFRKDTVLSGLGDIDAVGGGCLRTSWRMGVGNSSSEERCWRGGRWVVTQAETWAVYDSPSTPDVQVSIHEKRVLRNGRLRVVRADTTRERIR